MGETVPELIVSYATSGKKHEVYLLQHLARQLARKLPEMVVNAFKGISSVGPREMSIDIQGYDPGAYNVADLAVRMSLSRGAAGEVFNARDRLRGALRESIAIWLRKLVREQGLNHDFGDGIDINLVFADMCGINMTIDGKQRSVWGGASD